MENTANTLTFSSYSHMCLSTVPESLLHNMEREIDILLLEHTGNAASSKVTMAQAQSPSPSPNNFTTTSASTSSEEFAAQQQQQPRRPSQNAAMASPLVINRIKELFADHVPRENVILLREICEYSHYSVWPQKKGY